MNMVVFRADKTRTQEKIKRKVRDHLLKYGKVQVAQTVVEKRERESVELQKAEDACGVR